ncbi:uncharacterized protein BX663DRAFT_516593 [Cokeromyces recurvatus]|uniref:uncharacterized protein n=1 Tax=Cokeromyces recurvatus TaxID=90255 RepID=UPI00221E9CED|nr:uncharacterized protein BX663DRAFT_516593 [Cokeromyces recurvatus]KAI7900805.1 hypothetical protein BX663DRAFT_516593 [Cokeromyces recurvatus]
MGPAWLNTFPCQLVAYKRALQEFKTILFNILLLMVEDITREQALCIFFCLKHTESNVTIALKKAGTIKDVDVFFEENPYKPLLHCNERISSNPLKYKRYRSSLHLVENHVD